MQGGDAQANNSANVPKMTNVTTHATYTPWL